MTKIPYVLLILCLSGCISTEYIAPKQYLLATPTRAPSSFSKPIIYINTATAEGLANQTSFLYRIDNNQYLTDYYHTFLISPPQQVTSIITTYFENHGHFYPTTAAMFSTAKFSLQPKLLELYADYRNQPKGVITINFSLMNKTTVLFSKTYTSALPLAKKNTEALLAAWDQGLQQILHRSINDLNNTVALLQINKPQ